MYEIHELAGIVAMANEREQCALTEDIRVNGQHEPAVLWNGEIVDGRCRQLACVTLGMELKVKELDSSLSIDEVGIIVKSLNTRRNLTMPQKVVSGYKQQLRTAEGNVEIAKQWAISVRSLQNFKYIAKHRPEYVDPLFDGKSVVVYDPDKGYDVTTNKVSTLARIVKKAKEFGVVTVDDSEVVEFSVDAKIKTELGKNWYYGILATINSPGANKDVLVQKLLIELANLKYKE